MLIFRISTVQRAMQVACFVLQIGKQFAGAAFAEFIIHDELV